MGSSMATLKKGPGDGSSLLLVPGFRGRVGTLNVGPNCCPAVGLGWLSAGCAETVDLLVYPYPWPLQHGGLWMVSSSVEAQGSQSNPLLWGGQQLHSLFVTQHTFHVESVLT